MAFVNTAVVIGDDALTDSIIMRTITEYKEDRITSVGEYGLSHCTELVTVDLPNVTLVKSYAFINNSKLVTLNLPNLTNGSSYMFANCSALARLDLPKLGDLSNFAIDGCTSLEVLDLGVATTINARFYSNVNLATLILRNPNVVCSSSLSNFNVTKIGNGEGYIYVPRALLNDYKVATNWSVYANQIRALEDYTVDGTITGELDETKI